MGSVPRFARFAKLLHLALAFGLLFVMSKNAFALTASAPTLSTTTVNTLAKYTINGTTAAGTGAVAIGGTITIVFPQNTIVPATIAASNVTVQGTACTVAPTVTGQQVVVTTPVAIAKGTAFAVVIGATSNVITNPSQPGTTYTHTLATSTETTAVTSTAYTITASTTTQVTAATVTPNPSTDSATAQYTIAFNVGAAGRIGTTAQAGANTIVITFPAGTTVPASIAAANVTVNGTACTVAPTVSGQAVTITTPVTVASGGAVSVVFLSAAGIVNPATAGSYTLTVSTSAETTATTSNSYTITAAAPQTIVDDDTSPANKWAKASATNKAVSTFQLRTSSSTDTINSITVTRTGGADTDIASSGVKIWNDINNDNEYDAGDTLVESGTLSSGSVTIGSLSIAIDTTAKNYVITYDISASPTNGATLQAAVTNITFASSNTKTINDNADATITIDTTLPSTTDNASSTWTATSPVTVTLIPADTGSGVASTYYCVDTAGTCSPSTSGTSVSVTCSASSTCQQYVRYYSVDNAGNQESTKTSVVVRQDRQTPTTTDNVSSTWTATSPVTVTLTPTDGGSSVASTTYCVDTADSCSPESSGTSVSVTCTSGNECIQYVRYYSTDNVGNVESTKSSNPNTVRQDLKAPTDSASFTATSGDQQCSLSWNAATDSGSGLNSTDTYKLVYLTGATPPNANCSNGTDITAVTTGTSYNHTPLNNGTQYYYRVCAYDVVNNISTGITATCTPAAAATPPSVVSGPTASATQYGTYVDSPFDLSAQFNGNGSSTTCEYCASTDGTCDTEWASASGSGTGAFTCSKTGITGSNGASLTLNMRATNTGGTTTATAITRTVDSSAPTTSDNQTSSNWQNTEKTVTLSPVDPAPNSGVANTYYCLDGDATPDCSPSTSGTSITTACGAGTACTYDVRYYSVDNVSNTESTVTSSYKARVDRAAPAAVADLAGPTSTTTSVDLTWSNPSDGTGSGNASFDVRYREGSTFVEGDWAGASLATGEPTPPTTGMTVGSLTCGTTYTFAIKTTDNVSNISTISNAGTKATSACATAPTLTSPTATSITDTTATLGANITSDGGAALTARGTCWGTTAAPLTNCADEGGTAAGVFTQARAGLTSGAKLYYRGYATNSAGTGYSPDGSFYTKPTTQASGVNFTSVGSTTMTVNLTRGINGDGVIVLMKQGSAVDSDPVDGTYTGYTANAAFGSGTQLGTGNYVIYKGTDTSVAVTALTASTVYYVAAYEYKGTVDTVGNDKGTNYKNNPATGDRTTSAPSVQWTSASQASGGESGTMTITAQLSTASGLNVTVPYTVTGTATGSGTDYSITASPITITAGLTTGTTTITITSDTIDEDNETVIVTMGTPTNATKGATDVHTATITDDDAAPTVAFTLASSNGSEAATPANMAVSLSTASGKTVTVNYAVTGGTATGGGVDYTLTSGTLSFAPGVTTQNISATIVDDALIEGNETIIVTIYSPTNATLGATTTHTYTINDNDAPVSLSLSAPTETGYTDYKNPDSGYTTTTFRFKVIYTSSNAPSYVRVCIGDNDDSGSYPCYDMVEDDSISGIYNDGSYSNGEQFVYGPIGLGAAQDIRFYFEANDTGGTTKLPSDAPTSYYTGPTVNLMYAQNMVGVPKCLGASCTAGLSYTSVLSDDSGYSWCQTYNPATAKYVSCTSSTIKTGKGYWIYARSSNLYRLDEKNASGTDLAINVAAASFDISLQAGWNMISNPYNKRIPLDAASGPRVNVYNVTTSQEMQYETAVADTPTPWVSNYVSKYAGSVSGCSQRQFNGTPPAVLEPWVGYWIYVNCVDKNSDTFCDTLKLRVYRE